MSKAIAEGAAEIGVAGGLLLLNVLVPGVGAVITASETTALWGMLAGGIATEAAGIAAAIGSQAGIGVTTRQAAGARQIVRGEQRIGGTTVYCSTTGSTKRQYNMVIVLASHPLEAIVNLYLDGRQVFWNTSSSYNQTINGVNFGGDSDGNNHTGPNGQQYNFRNEVFCAAFLGNQNANPTVVSGSWVGPSVWNDGGAAYPGFCSALQANDGTWSPQVVPGPGTASGSLGWNGSGDGEIDSISLDDPGANYPNGPVEVTITDLGGMGSGANATANAVGGSIAPSSLAITSAGLNYSNPQVAFAPPSATTMTPYLAGCSYVYLKIEADSGNFPAFPEIRFTVKGKNDIYDPRTGERGYSSNWALNIADAITDPTWGLGDNSVNQDQLIAAANVCDEQVACAAGAESRYSLHWHYNSSISPGDAIAHMMDAAEGRLSRIGGEWYIWPAYWQGPSFTFDANALVDAIQWTPKRPMADLCNRVTGTYIAPNFPYNVVGNLYDSNGYWNGETQNNFSYAFQPTNYPMYACDARHGYGTGVDVYLTQDGGIYLPIERTQDCVLSISQAQRLAKIYMLRNRQQGSGTFPMSLAAWQAQPVDVIDFNMPALGWTNKVLEIVSVKFRFARAEGDPAPACTLEVGVQETDPSVYEWDASEELTAYDVAVLTTLLSQYMVAAPTSLAAVSDLATALVQPNGQVMPRIELTWTEPADTYVQNGGSIEIQMCAHSSGTWQDVAIVGGQTTQVFLSGVISGLTYDVRVRSIRSSGAIGDWVELDGIGVGAALSAAGLSLVAPTGTLSAYATSSAGVSIQVNPFVASFNSFTANCLSAGPYTIPNLLPGDEYWVYYIDPTFAGGAITPVATQNVNDFLLRPGYYLIGSLITPGIGGGFAQLEMAPSQMANLGETANVGSPAGPAVVSGMNVSGSSYWGEAVFSNFAPPLPAATLSIGFPFITVTAAVSGSGAWLITASDVGNGGGAKPSGAIGTLNPRGAWAASTAYSLWDTYTVALSEGLGRTFVATMLVTSAYTSGLSLGATDYANTCIVVASGAGALPALNNRGARAGSTAYAQWDYFTDTSTLFGASRTATYMVASAFTSSPGSLFSRADQAHTLPVVVGSGAPEVTYTAPINDSVTTQLNQLTANVTVNAPSSAGNASVTIDSITVSP